MGCTVLPRLSRHPLLSFIADLFGCTLLPSLTRPSLFHFCDFTPAIATAVKTAIKTIPKPDSDPEEDQWSKGVA